MWFWMSDVHESVDIFHPIFFSLFANESTYWFISQYYLLYIETSDDVDIKIF